MLWLELGYHAYIKPSRPKGVERVDGHNLKNGPIKLQQSCGLLAYSISCRNSGTCDGWMFLELSDHENA